MKLITIEDIRDDYKISTGDVNITNKGAYTLFLEKNYLQAMNAWMKSTQERQVTMSNLGEAIAKLTGDFNKFTEDATTTAAEDGGSETP